MGLDGRARILPLSGLLALSLGCASAHAGSWPHETGASPRQTRVAQGAILGSMAGAAIGAGVDHRNRGRGAVLGGLGGLIAGAIFGDQIRHHEAWHQAHSPYGHPHAHDHAPHDHGPDCDGEHTWEDDYAYEEEPGGYGWEEEPRSRERAPDPPAVEAPLAVEVLFDPGSSVLTPGAEARLRHLAREVRDRHDVELLLRGHSDDLERGGFELSEARARAVRAFLNEEGVSVRRIAWVGFGDAQPVASNETAVGRQRNRRVEIVLRAPEADPYARLYR